MRKINIIKYTVGMPVVVVAFLFVVIFGVIVDFGFLIFEGAYTFDSTRETLRNIIVPVSAINYPSDNKFAKWLMN